MLWDSNGHKGPTEYLPWSLDAPRDGCELYCERKTLGKLNWTEFNLDKKHSRIRQPPELDRVQSDPRTATIGVSGSGSKIWRIFLHGGNERKGKSQKGSDKKKKIVRRCKSRRRGSRVGDKREKASEIFFTSEIFRCPFVYLPNGGNFSQNFFLKLLRCHCK